ncbi:hypothetical protein F25303_7171 [Fusarium sp. NRRL 25303]|nr:hypothetical protein F25303_7171 [Fusarium sp. NRRL 25303]
MFQHYCKSKEYIQQAHLEAELPGSLLQDALVVANFPSKNQLLHIEKWSQGQLPNPFLNQDSATIDRLDRLYTQLAIYIEDYITKATSISPPRSYMCIPSPCSNVDQLQYRGQPIGIDILRVETLTDVERNRLFRAFFRYELVSKIRCLQDRIELELINELVAPIFKNFSHGEAEALRCVRHYMKKFYGVVLAYYAEPQLPDRPAKTAAVAGKLNPNCGLRFFDKMWISSEEISEYLFQEPKTHHEFLEFDLMTRPLSVPRDDKGCPMRLFAEIPMHLKQLDMTRVMSMSHIFDEGDCYPLDNRRWDEWSEIGQALRDNGSITFTYGRDLCDFESRLQNGIYRQRAWAFFDHAGYYSEGNISRHFRTLRQLEDEDFLRSWA